MRPPVPDYMDFAVHRHSDDLFDPDVMLIVSWGLGNLIDPRDASDVKSIGCGPQKHV